MDTPIRYRGTVSLLPSVFVDEQALAIGKHMGFTYEALGNDKGLTYVLRITSVDYEPMKTQMLQLMEQINWATYHVEAELVNSIIDNKWNAKRLPVVHAIPKHGGEM